MRDPEKPIARLFDTDTSVDRAAHRIAWYAFYAGPQRVFVADSGHVLSVSVGTAFAERWCGEHPDWFVGTYHAHDHKPWRGSRNDLCALITAALEARRAELARRAA